MINYKAYKNVAFKNNAPFGSCISKFNSTLINNSEDLGQALQMYNLLEYSRNYSMISGNIWSYYGDKTDDVNDNTSDGKSFKYETKLVGKIPKIPEQPPQPLPNPDGYQPPLPSQPSVPTLNVEVTIPLKYLSNFWIFYGDLPLTNCDT